MRGRRRPSLLLPLAAVAACGFESAQVVLPPVAKPYKASGVYAVGEKVGWTIAVPPGALTPAGKYVYVVKENNDVTLKTGEFDLTSGTATIETTLDHPAMLYVSVAPPPSGRPMALGAAVAPRELKPVVSKPKDFDAFWKGKLAELRAVPANPILTPGESDRPDVEYATIAMQGPNGTHVYGQIARPKAPGKHPAIALFQWASPPYPLQRSWVTGLASRGFIVLDIEPHDVLPTEPAAYYQALPDPVKRYEGVGRDDRDQSYFVAMYQRDVRAVDYLAGLPDWDGKTLVAMGTSMGGQQSFAAAGLCPQVTHMIVEVPAGCDLNAGLHGRQEGYPNFPTNDARTMETARYVDAVNFASRSHAASLVGMGFVDTAAPPAGIWTAFNALKGPKEAAPMRDAPHNNLATREQQLPYTTRADAWLDALAKTGRVEPRGEVGKP